MEIGDIQGEGATYINFGDVFDSLGEYKKAKEYYEKALAIRMEIGDRQGEGVDYGNLGKVFKISFKAPCCEDVNATLGAKA